MSLRTITKTQEMNHAEQLTELIFFVTNNFGNDYFDDSSDTNKDLKYFGS